MPVSYRTNYAMPARRHPLFREAVMLKSFLLTIAIVAFVLSAAPSHARPAQQDSPAPAVPPAAAPPAAQTPPAAVQHNPVKPTAASQTRAKTIYQMDCAVCHGDNGNGQTDLAKGMGVTLANWTDPKSLENIPEGDLFSIIRNGKDKMPAEGSGRAKDDEVWNLVIYIRNFSKGQPNAPAAASN